MDFLDNVFSDLERKSEESETTSSLTPWQLSVRNLCYTVQAQISKNRTPLIKNRYAQMDMYIFIGFQCYVFLCGVHRDPDLCQAFLEWYQWYGNHNGIMLNKEKDLMFQSRLIAYDEIMQSSCENMDQELLQTLVDFIAKDKDKIPFDPALVVFPIDTIVPIYSEATALYKLLMKAIQKPWQELCNNRDYITFQS